MSKDIPEIDDLTRGINDSELILTQDTAGTQVEQNENNNEAQEKDTAVSLSDQDAGMTSWNTFNRTIPKRTKQKDLSASLTVTLRIHWMTAIYMADAALTW